MKRLGWLFLISFSLLLGACSLGVSDEDVCREDGALFADKFDGTETCGWALYNRGGTVVSIEEEALRISTSQPGQIWWTNPGRQFDDVIVTVDARQLEGPNGRTQPGPRQWRSIRLSATSSRWPSRF